MKSMDRPRKSLYVQSSARTRWFWRHKLPFKISCVPVLYPLSKSQKWKIICHAAFTGCFGLVLTIWVTMFIPARGLGRLRAAGFSERDVLPLQGSEITNCVVYTGRLVRSPTAADSLESVK